MRINEEHSATRVARGQSTIGLEGLDGVLYDIGDVCSYMVSLCFSHL